MTTIRQDADQLAQALREVDRFLRRTQGYTNDDWMMLQSSKSLAAHYAAVAQNAPDTRVEELEHELAAWKQTIGELCYSSAQKLYIERRVAKLLEKEHG